MKIVCASRVPTSPLVVCCLEYVFSNIPFSTFSDCTRKLLNLHFTCTLSDCAGVFARVCMRVCVNVQFESVYIFGN
jgi:hypothetical protein